MSAKQARYGAAISVRYCSQIARGGNDKMMSALIASRLAHMRALFRAFRCAGGGGRAAPPAAGDAGFTILEILVVITIIGMLIGLVAPAALRQLGGARVSAKQSIARLGTVLDLYNLDMGSYPTPEQGWMRW